MDHDLVVTTYVVPSYCSKCHNLLVGFAQQGKRCRKCKKDFHFDCRDEGCMENLKDTPQDSMIELPPTPDIRSPSINVESVDPIKPEPIKAFEKSSASSERSVTPSLSPVTKETGRKSPSLIDQFVSSVGATRKAIQKEWSDMNKPLDMRSTMPKNTVEFLLKVGGMCDAQDSITSLLMWQVPSRTILAWITWNLVCFFPSLIVISPFVALLHMIYSFIPHEDAKVTKPALEKASSGSTSGGWTSYLQSTLIAASTGIDKDEVAKLVNNVNYQKNLQFLQNVQGQYCKVYDNIIAGLKYIDWSDPATTKSIAIGCALAIPIILYVLNRVISLGTVVWIAGNLMFAGNTAIGRTLMTDALPILTRTAMDALGVQKDSVKSAASSVKSWVKKSEKRIGTGQESQVQVYENHRWWAGLGFQPSLLRSDGFAWSDLDRMQQRPHKDEVDLPQEAGFVYEWADDWKIDMDFIVENVKAVPRNGEEGIGGWIYMDNAWEHPYDKPGWFSVTRRRLWTRTMRKFPESDGLRKRVEGGRTPGVADEHVNDG